MILTDRQKKKLKARRLKKLKLKKKFLENKMSKFMENMMNDMKKSLEKHREEGDYAPKTMQQISSSSTD